MKRMTLVSAAATGALALLLGRAALELRETPQGLGAVVDAGLAQSGVTHPVTAVLLNFRSYDTWLELIVLVLAVTGAVAARFELAPRAGAFGGDPLAAHLVAALIPLMLLAGGYLLYAGSHAPGGAFQAGAVLAAAFVLLHLSGHGRIALSPGLTRALLVLGAAAFAFAAIAGLAREGALLAYPPAHAGAVILALEIAATASIAVALAALVVGQMKGYS